MDSVSLVLNLQELKGLDIKAYLEDVIVGRDSGYGIPCMQAGLSIGVDHGHHDYWFVGLV